MTIFKSRFNSKCARCQNTINIGELTTIIDAKAYHANCYQDLVREQCHYWLDICELAVNKGDFPYANEARKVLIYWLDQISEEN